MKVDAAGVEGQPQAVVGQLELADLLAPCLPEALGAQPAVDEQHAPVGDDQHAGELGGGDREALHALVGLQPVRQPVDRRLVAERERLAELDPRQLADVRGGRLDRPARDVEQRLELAVRHQLEVHGLGRELERRRSSSPRSGPTSGPPSETSGTGCGRAASGCARGTGPRRSRPRPSPSSARRWRRRRRAPAPRSRRPGDRAPDRSRTGSTGPAGRGARRVDYSPEPHPGCPAYAGGPAPPPAGLRHAAACAAAASSRVSGVLPQRVRWAYSIRCGK